MSEQLIKNKSYMAQLSAVMLFNIVAFWTLYKTGALLEGNFPNLMKDWQNALVPGFAGLLTMLITGVFDHTMKARIVFLRWRNPLPGTRVFSEYLRSDPRIDVARLREKVGTFPREPNKQNALWYRLYRTVDSRPEIMQVHKDYLISRDWACISVLLFLILVPASVALFPSKNAVLVFGSMIAAEYFFARMTAVNASKRFLMTVLAIKATES